MVYVDFVVTVMVLLRVFRVVLLMGLLMGLLEILKILISDGFRGVSNKSNGVFSLQLLNCRLVCIRNMNRFHNGVYYKSFAVY